MTVHNLISGEVKMMVSGLLEVLSLGNKWNTWAVFLILLNYLLGRVGPVAQWV